MKKRTINPDEKIDKVIETARRLFVEKGYCGVSIPTIVKESGVSTGAIYSYFADKEALAREIHRRTVVEFSQMFRDRLEGRTSIYEVLKTFTKLICELTEHRPNMMKYMLFMQHGGIVYNLPPVCSTEPFRLLQEHLKQAIAAGEIRVKDFMIAGLSYTGVTLRAAELRFEGVLQQPLPEICDILVEIGWRAICV